MLEQLIVLVEEPSMEAALAVLLPRILGEIPFEIHAFQCKTELLQRLPQRLLGYARWLPEGHKILVLVDRDDDDCRELKARLEQCAQAAGLVTRSAAGEGHFQVVNRIVVEELEAWFFGDWEAVRAAYPRVPLTVPQKERFRDPDAIRGGTWEALERILQRAGHVQGGLGKKAAAHAIALHMEPSRNRSGSFQAFHAGLRAAMGGACP